MRFVLATALLLVSALTWATDMSLTPSEYKLLNEAQELITNQDYEKAEAKLDGIEKREAPRFGLALAYQLHGQLYLAKEENEKALDFFVKSLNLGVLAPDQEANIATTAAQILLSLERPKEAYDELAPRLTRILEQEQAEHKRHREEHRRQAKHGEAHKPVVYVQPQNMITVATACQLQKDYKGSIPWIKRALKRAESPKENWLLMLMVALYQDNQLEATAQVLDDLIRLHPKEDYWMQQAGVYQQLEQTQKSLQTLETAYAGGYLLKPANQMLLVQLLLGQGLPDRAGRLLNELMVKQQVELNERNWRLLASAWQQSRDRDQAVSAMLSASEFMQDGSLIFRAAQLQAQDLNHAAVLSTIQKALDKGLNEKDKASAIMLAATSAYELHDFASARRYFQQALRFANTAVNAKSWLDYLASLEEFS